MTHADLLREPARSGVYGLPEGATIHDLIEKLSLPLEAIKIIFLNGREAETDTVLHDGDQVALSPVTGAM